MKNWTTEQLLTTANRYEAIMGENGDPTGELEKTVEAIEVEIGIRHARGEAI